MKVVINRCFGGFGLSPLAIKEYLKRKGKECHIYDPRQYLGRYIYVGTIDINIFGLAFSTKYVGKEVFWKDIEPYCFYASDISRTDKDLVSVVEELGKGANGMASSLKVVEIPDDVEWEISEYDGLETVEEKHRSWG